MTFYKRIWNFIIRDVKNDNETKRASVIMRLFSLIICVYFVLQIVMMGIGNEWEGVFASMVCLAGYMGAFYMTYQNRTRAAILYTVLSTLIWVVFFIILFGWDCGVQHFLLALLVFFFVVSHASTKSKLCMALILFVMRLILFDYTRDHAPVIELGGTMTFYLQIINTFTIFALITAVIMMFCQESLAMERKLVVYNAKLREASRRDPLTKLFNRRAMVEYMEEQIDRLNRYGNWFNVAIGDIDFFKKVNDTYGHEAGDTVLIHVADLLSDYMKSRGCVGRWGGEEFLLVFRDINGEEAFIELEKIRSMIERMKIPYKDEEISVTMTFGLDEYNNSKPIDYTINSADQKLYMGKNTGRNKVVF